MRKVGAVLAVAVVGALMGTGVRADSLYSTTVESFNPVAYWQFSTSSGGQTNSSVNGYVGTLENGATVGGTGPLTNDASNTALVLNNPAGSTEFLNTNYPSGANEISNAGTIVAWINLAQLPSGAGRFFQIGAQAQGGNDFDFQIETDNEIKFYTDSGSATVDPTALTNSDLNQWIFVAGTFTAGGERDIYVNGVLAATGTAGGHSADNDDFSVGANDVFSGRYFNGEIDEVAVYNTALTGADVAEIYASRNDVVNATPVPAAVEMGLPVVVLAGLLGWRRRRVC
ncbi:MAG TPA: LamG domain-containing protein [Phycisphaerae bacterium]|nr:LamG domain-containing protein [Phycisphaerae bacterium]